MNIEFFTLLVKIIKMGVLNEKRRKTRRKRKSKKPEKVKNQEKVRILENHIKFCLINYTFFYIFRKCIF